jgi:hypothetical protein
MEKLVDKRSDLLETSIIAMCGTEAFVATMVANESGENSNLLMARATIHGVVALTGLISGLGIGKQAMDVAIAIVSFKEHSILYGVFNLVKQTFEVVGIFAIAVISPLANWYLVGVSEGDDVFISLQAVWALDLKEFFQIFKNFHFWTVAAGIVTLFFHWPVLLYLTVKGVNLEAVKEVKFGSVFKRKQKAKVDVVKENLPTSDTDIQNYIIKNTNVVDANLFDILHNPSTRKARKAKMQKVVHQAILEHRKLKNGGSSEARLSGIHKKLEKMIATWMLYDDRIRESENLKRKGRRVHGSYNNYKRDPSHVEEEE